MAKRPSRPTPTALADRARDVLQVLRLRSPQRQALVMDRLTTTFAQHTATYAKGLATGRLDLDQWQRLMARELRSHHLAAALTGATDTRTALAVAERNITRQLGFLDGFVNDIRSSKVPVDSEAMIRQRSKLYGGAARGTFFEAATGSKGLPQLERYPADGSTACHTNCHCSLDFDEDEANHYVYWRLGDAEHCEDCEALAAEWSPLTIAKGE